MKRIKHTVLVSGLFALAVGAAAGGELPVNGMAKLLDDYVTAGRIAGVVSVLSDADYNVQFN